MTPPAGFAYIEEFITAEGETNLLEEIRALPLREAAYKQYTAKRRILSFDSALPFFILPLREKVARWSGVAPEEFGHALLTHYPPGTALGWHRDVPNFEIVIGVSLLGPCRMRFRPYPPRKGARKDILQVTLEPRSVYRLQGAVRWEWQHSIPATPGERYSVTFRSPRHSAS